MNQAIFHFLNGLAGQNLFFDRMVTFFATEFPYLLIVGIFVFLLMHKDKKKGARDLFVVIVSAGVAWFVAKLIKHFYPEPRPSAILGTHVLFAPDDNQSFPSGHATFFSALPSALYFYHKKIAFWYAIGALLIGLSRVVGGIHWPIDILVGYILGGLIGAGVYYSYKHYL
ncbi:MAG: phosphatase PAP2 family protein [Candidatus Pacebacteria bacterium]|nr:phosphatase PAP2 family protein [Candidatus Paceibacterota bacterium]